MDISQALENMRETLALFSMVIDSVREVLAELPPSLAVELDLIERLMELTGVEGWIPSLLFHSFFPVSVCLSVFMFVCHFFFLSFNLSFFFHDFLLSIHPHIYPSTYISFFFLIYFSYSLSLSSSIFLTLLSLSEHTCMESGTHCSHHK